MCRTLSIPRSLVYYKKKTRVYNTKLENEIIKIFRESKNNYGSRKIKVELKKKNMIASRRKIRQIMDKYRLVSNYTVKQYKVHKNSCNEDKVKNIVNREFDNRNDLEAFNIKRSLSKKGCPFDNAVAEAGYKIIKTEFAFNRIFKSLDELKMELISYVRWYNNKRIHSSLNYMTPVEYRLTHMTE